MACKAYLQPNERHSVKLGFNVTPDDMTAIRAAAKKSPYRTLSAFLRIAALEASKQKHESH